jgi:ThiF family protein/E2/UBC family protein B
MMDGQADSQLNRTYRAAANQARRYLASRYRLEDCPPSSFDYPSARTDLREVWRVTVNGATQPQDFIVAVPYTFPDVLPKVYIPVESAKSARQIPHFDNNRFLCGYDEVTAKPNADDPSAIALSVLTRAVEVFRDGVNGTNQTDYNQELDAYWSLDCTLFALSLVGPDSELKRVVLVQLIPTWRHYSYVFAATEEDARAWIEAVGCSSKIDVKDVPFLHLQTLGQPPLPTTNGAVYDLLKRYDETNLAVLISYLKKSDRPSAVMFSAPVDAGSRMLGAWWHPAILHEVNRGPGQAKRYRGIIPGFTPNSSGAALAELSIANKQAKLIRAAIDRVDKARLFGRTVGNSPIALEHRVNIIGCGSLGSFTAASLTQTGLVDDLRLIDPQNLEVENVQRHYCGMSDIDEPKVEATKRKLRAHYPHLDCETHQKDVLEILRTSPTALSPSSLTVITVADIAVERRLNQQFTTTNILGNGPICFMWVEPHMLAGHVAFIRRGFGCFECVLDEAFRFRGRVVDNTDDFSRREAGCQTTFFPYSGLDVSEFVVQAVRFMMTQLQNDASSVFSWIGDIERAPLIGAELADDWKSSSPFSAHTKSIQPNSSCPVCRNNERSISNNRHRIVGVN